MGWPRGDVISLGALFLALGVVGCGSRTGLGGPVGPAYRRDGGARDAAPSDGPRRVDGALPDLLVPRDRQGADACLPIAASKVQGNYKGGWKGTWSCPGDTPQSVSGSLSFNLTPAGSPDAFNVKGSMSGVVDPGVPFSAGITGSMGCTALAGNLPKIVVGSGGLIYELSGTMVGTFQASPQGFAAGSWKAKEVGGSCGASGSWFAYK